MPRTTNDGAELYYEGSGADEAVVFVQGLGCGRWMWRWQREAVAGEYDVVAPDTRGTGRSDAALSGALTRLPRRVRAPLLRRRFGYSAAGLAGDLEAVLSDADVERAHLVGAGLGGMIALQYALEYPRVESLTLVATSHGGPDAASIPEAARERLFAASGGERERIRERMRPVFTERFTNRNPHLLDRIVEWRREQDASDPAREAQTGALLGFDVADELHRIRVPTLVVHGTDDRVIPVENARLLHEKLSDARLETIEGGPHCCPVERDDRVTEALLEFLAEAS